MNTGLALWLIFESVFSLYFEFLKCWVRIFFVFCILEIVDSYFFFLYFVFLSNCIRIVFVFFLYLFRIFFVKIQKNTKKIHFVFLYFFCIFPLRPSPSQIALCPFVFFAFFRHAVKEQNRESINVYIYIYVVFSFC